MLAKCAGIYTQVDKYFNSLEVENVSFSLKTTKVDALIIDWYSDGFGVANGSSIVANAPFVKAKRSFVNAKGSSKVAKESFVNANASFVNANGNFEFAIASFISAKENFVTANESFAVDVRSFGNDKNRVNEKVFRNKKTAEILNFRRAFII